MAGLGRMGAVHAANVARRCPSAELVGVFDPRPEVAQSLAAELGVVATGTYDDLLGNCPVDGVIIASPTAAHAELARRAAQAGKHVFCEKPISLHRDVTVEVVRALGEAGVKLQVGFHRRFDASCAAAAERARAGELGDVYLFRASQRDKVPPKPEFLAGSGGIFVDMAIHDLDLARWFVGDVATVNAHGAALSDPRLAEIGDFDSVAVVLSFVTGALGVLDVSRVAGYGYDSSVEVMGSKATVRVDEPFLYGYEWRSAGVASRPLVQTFDRRYLAAFTAEIEHFARSVLDDTTPAVTGSDALAAFDLARAAERACRLGQAVSVTPTGEPALARRGLPAGPPVAPEAR